MHIEIQGEKDADFSLRMFRYFYRIFDRYGRRVVSMAILTGTEQLPSEGHYALSAYGSGVEFRYITRRLMAYNQAELERNASPAALVVLAAQERERLRRSGERFDVKLRLIRQLYERGYDRAQIIGLFEFIDWVVQLSEAEDSLFWETLKTLEEEKHMPYVTTGERIGREQGLQQGLQQGSLEEARLLLLEALDERFGQVPAPLAETIRQLEDREQLRRLLRQAIRCPSLDEFTALL